MAQLLISISILAFIVITHILVRKWAVYIQEKYAGNDKKTRIAVFALFMSIAVLFASLAFFLSQSSF